MGEPAYLVALTGNPNVGKSTVFNRLTGLDQHTGNWPGKTVVLYEGVVKHNDKTFRLVDLPGTYSLRANSKEEEVARDFIVNENPDVIVCVVDATSLERNLNLVLQIIPLTKNCIVCLNLMDEARERGLIIDVDVLTRELAIPVIPTSARSNEGMAELMDAIHTSVTEPECRDSVLVPAEKEAANVRTSLALCDLAADDQGLGDLAFDPAPSSFEFGDSVTETSLCPREAVKTPNDPAADTASVTDGLSISDAAIAQVYARAEDIVAACVRVSGEADHAMTNRLDGILTSGKLGIPIMLLLLGMVFAITLCLANYPSQLLSWALFSIEPHLSRLVLFLGAPKWLHSMLVTGVYRTLAWVVAVMLPPMAIFFPLFTLLEDFGYLPRIAFNLDHLFHRSGGHGKQALTMSMGFGCNAAGVVACRIIESPRERLIAILTNNFVPCNGRFPTLIMLATVFFAGSGFIGSVLPAVVVTGTIATGVGATFLVSRLLSTTLLKGTPSSFVLELPPYRKPDLLNVIARSWKERTIWVLKRAVAVAAPCGAITWIFANLNVQGISLLARAASSLHPVAAVMGIDGVILLAFILGFPANEIVIPIAMMSYLSQGAMAELQSLTAMGEILRANGWTWMTALSVMLFSLLHYPCGTTVFTILKETGSWKWVLVSVVLPTLLATGLLILLNALFRLM